MLAPSSRETLTSRQAGSDHELGGRGKLRGADLAAVGRPDAEHADAAVRAGDREALGIDRDHFAHLAGDAGGLLGRQRFGVENLQLLAVVQRPGAGLRIAAADQIVDLRPRLAPVDARVVGRAPALVARPRFVLLDALRLAGLDEIDVLRRAL